MLKRDFKMNFRAQKMAELNVSKKSITALLGVMQNRLFVIPEYQRPYQWTTEHCDVLWEDIKYFSENSKEREYFLGTLVYAKNGENLDVIDGQQRLTSFFLLLPNPADHNISVLSMNIHVCEAYHGQTHFHL